MQLDDVFPSSSDKSGRQQGSIASSFQADSENGKTTTTKIASKYLGAYKSAEMRSGILMNELDDAKTEMENIRKRKNNLKSGTIIFIMRNFHFFSGDGIKKFITSL